METLADDFIPGAFDVICSRGKAAYQHQGNRSFRATLEHHLPSYSQARSKQEKTDIVTMVYHGIQTMTPDGGFIRKNEKGQWCRVPGHVAREKVGQGFRDLLHTEYRSSTKAKIKRRKYRLYPPLMEPPTDGGTQEPASPARSCTGTHSAWETPSLVSQKASKSVSYDSEPLQLREDPNEMSFLTQCSFSFITAGEKSQDAADEHLTNYTPASESHSCTRTRPDSSLRQGCGQGHLESISTATSGALQGGIFRPLSQLKNPPGLRGAQKSPPQQQPSELFCQQYAPYYYGGSYQDDSSTTRGSEPLRPGLPTREDWDQRGTGHH